MAPGTLVGGGGGFVAARPCSKHWTSRPSFNPINPRVSTLLLPPFHQGETGNQRFRIWARSRSWGVCGAGPRHKTSPNTREGHPLGYLPAHLHVPGLPFGSQGSQSTLLGAPELHDPEEGSCRHCCLCLPPRQTAVPWASACTSVGLSMPSTPPEGGSAQSWGVWGEGLVCERSETE